MSADEYCPGLVAAARLVAVLAKDPPSWNADTPDTRRHVSGADGTSVELPIFYQPGVTPKAVSGAFPTASEASETLALQSFRGVGPNDHADHGDAPRPERLVGPNADLIGEEPDEISVATRGPHGFGTHVDEARGA